MNNGFKSPYQLITDRILHDLENGVAAWVKPSSTEATAEPSRPMNFSNATVYRGVNTNKQTGRQSMTDNKLPRAGIADQISDLKTMRGKIEGLKIIGYSLLSGYPDAPTAIIDDLKQGMAAMEQASKFAQDKVRELYAAPTPVIANEDKEEAA
jgi:hypothetical protein